MAITSPKPANTRRLLDGVDARTARGRRFKDLALSIAAEAGGAARLSPQRVSLVRCAAMMLAQSEALLTQAISGERVDPDLLVRLNAAASNALDRLGLAPSERQ